MPSTTSTTSVTCDGDGQQTEETHLFTNGSDAQLDLPAPSTALPPTSSPMPESEIAGLDAYNGDNDFNMQSQEFSGNDTDEEVDYK